MRLSDEHAPARALLDAYCAERETLLQRIQELAERDDRIRACWLFGSLGRGEEDDLSDLDVWMVVADAHLPAIKAERQDYVRQVGTPLVLLEAPQNAPRGGAYLMAIYDAPSGPHQVDWYWQAESAARIPQQTRLLLDRAGLPPSETPTRFTDMESAPERTPLEAAVQSVCFFWVMILITAKYAARSPYEARMNLLAYAYDALQGARRFAGLPPAPEAESLPPHPEPAAKLALLRELAAQMEGVMPHIEAAGGSVPTEVAPRATRYFDLIEAITEAQSPPQA